MRTLHTRCFSVYTCVTFPFLCMNHRSVVFFTVFVLTLAACTPPPSVQVPVASDSSSSSSSSATSSVTVLSTRNVSFVGTVTDLGPSVIQEGTHALALSDGSTIILRSSDHSLTLGTYLGKKVEVRGSVQPTVEAGGTIMSVEEVTVLEVSASSSQSSEPTNVCGGLANIQCPSGFSCVDDLSDDCDESRGGADCTGLCVPLASSSVRSASSAVSAPASSSTSSSKVSSSIAAPKPSSSSQSTRSSASSDPVSSSRASLELVAMSKQNYSTSSLWTQQYCTSHIAFCVSVHKNWYFKSFGATTKALWHVEFALSDIYELNQGIILLNLMSGPSSATGGTSGEVKMIGTDVVGYLDWKGDHFEIIGDASLREAISYMLTSIKPYTLGE